MTIRNLFRGQCIGVSVDEIASDIILTLDLEDYNRLPPILNVGAPSGDIGLTQDDGTVLWIDPRGGNNGAIQAFDTNPGGGYWPFEAPTLDLVTGFLAPDMPGLPTIDFMTALSDLKTYVDTQAPYVSGALKWWLAPPPSGDGLILYWIDYLDTAQTDLFHAPYDIDNDNPDWITTVMPSKLGPFSWNWAGIRGSGYVRGGTPAPEGSGYIEGGGPIPSGNFYIDAPGSITDDDKQAIAAWHMARDFIELMTSSAVLLPSSPLDQSTYFGWAPGQTILITSAKHSRFAGHEINERSTVIQRVSGRLVTPAPGIGISIEGVPLSVPFEWRTLNWAASMAGPEKATVVIHLLGPGEEIGLPEAPEDLVITPGDTFASLVWSGIEDAGALAIPKNGDVWITWDDEKPVDIEWTLELGDVPAGALSIELAQAAIKPPKPPVYHFGVTFDVAPPGEPAIVKAQLKDASENGVPLAGVPFEWVILANDDAGDPIDTTGWLADDTGTTDTAGAEFTTLTVPDDTAKAIEISALALPIV